MPQRTKEAVPAVESAEPSAVEPNAAVIIDLGRQHLLVDGAPVAVTYREFRLLRHLILRAGEIVTRDELIDAQRTWSKVANLRTIDVHIRRLRLKLGAYAEILRTERGVGYRYDEHPDVWVLAP